MPPIGTLRYTGGRAAWWNAHGDEHVEPRGAVHQVVVHAHCYQPPRENPWLEVVEAEPSAVPDHDWNARIDRECYARLAAAEVRVRETVTPNETVDPDGRAGLARLVNLYAWCTFDVGATLCEWLEAEAPDTLRAMQAGDAASVQRWGHGNAIAAPYHHVILPLASPRDRRTEVRWGMADFRRRFGREPEGLWLPECAADEDTLALLVEEGIRFTILAPYQVETAGETHGLPVRWQGAGGRSLTILPYDGSLAGEVAFGGLLKDAQALARRLAPTLNDGQARCTTLATDGETFGHHHHGGDRTLASALAIIASRNDARLTNAASIVARNAPTLNATLVSPSSWSCAHGVDRWRANCGCRIDHQRPPAQQWRGPLRNALSWLADRANAVYDAEATVLFGPAAWDVRDHYGDVVSGDGAVLADFVRNAVTASAVMGARTDTHAFREQDVARGRELLELQRAMLRMFTSCAWFFDEVDRIEARQVLRYAARVLELSGQGAELSPEFLTRLEAAHGPTVHSAPAATARDAFVRSLSSSAAEATRSGAGALALVASGIPCARLAAYDVRAHWVPPLADASMSADAAGQKGHGTVTLTHRRTGAEYALHGTVSGVGPALRVHIADSGSPNAPQWVTMAELPESVAVMLLQPHLLGDVALLG